MASNPASEVEKTKRLIQQLQSGFSWDASSLSRPGKRFDGHVTCFSARNAYSRHEARDALERSFST
jgi:hypothetical protein